MKSFPVVLANPPLTFRIKEIFGDSKRPVQKEDLARLKYCEAVIYESLRLFPPVPAAMRVIETDTELGNFSTSLE